MRCCTIYKLTNIVNGKVYIGQTWQSLQDRWVGHCNNNGCIKFHNAIKKHGRAAFTKEVLTVCHTQEVADHWEAHFIKRHDSIASGYNLREGGSRGAQTEATKRKLSFPLTAEQETAIRNDDRSLRTIAKDYGCSHRVIQRLRGKTSEADRKRRVSRSLVGNRRSLGNVGTEASKAKRAASRKGYRHSEATKAKMSAAQLIRAASCQ